MEREQAEAICRILDVLNSTSDTAKNLVIKTPRRIKGGGGTTEILCSLSEHHMFGSPPGYYLKDHEQADSYTCITCCLFEILDTVQDLSASLQRMEKQ